jgi:choline dehydrogenase-like flavoprotein
MRNLVVFLLGAAVVAMPAERFDVVVYGATSGGAIAAIAAAKEGARVALLEPGRHAGGMLTGGLGRTEMDRQESVIDRKSDDYFERARHYGNRLVEIRASVAERTLNEWLKEAGVRVLFDRRLASIRKQAGRIVSLRTTSGDVFEAPVFIDSSHEGDLMKAGVSYVAGRDSISCTTSPRRQAGLPARKPSIPKPCLRLVPWKAPPVRPGTADSSQRERGAASSSPIVSASV